MIKKALFEDELIHGMQRELQAHDKKQGMENLVKAADYLHSAVEIFEEAGLTSKADQILEILSKIAAKNTRVREMPSFNKLLEHGVLPEDFKNLNTSTLSKARVNTAYRKMGLLDREIGELIGHHNVMSEDEAASILNQERGFAGFPGIEKFLENPQEPFGPGDVTGKPVVQTPKEFSITPIRNERAKEPGTGEEFVFKSIAQELGVDDNDAIVPKPRKPKDPTKVSDRHTKGLTPDRMVDNLKDHGTMFNLSDDGNVADDNNVDIEQPKSFENEYIKWLRMKGELPDEAPPTERMPKAKKRPDFGDLEGLIVMDDAEADDILDADIEEKPLIVHEHGASQTFEDSD